MTDKELLDGLQSMSTSKIICRHSTMGRGWRLHETRKLDSVDNVREAIEIFLKENGF